MQGCHMTYRNAQHCQKKIRDLQKNPSLLTGFGTLLVAVYEYFVGKRKKIYENHEAQSLQCFTEQ